MSNKEMVTMDVVVHKANIPMMKGESISDFTHNLSKAGMDHVMKKLNMTKETGSAYMVEAFSDHAVFSTYKFKDNGPSKFVAFKYSRNEDGNFEFGNTFEVERVTTYKPKDTMVSKVKDAKKEEEDEEKGCGGKTKKSMPQIGDWVETGKSFWGGVI